MCPPAIGRSVSHGVHREGVHVRALRLLSSPRPRAGSLYDDEPSVKLSPPARSRACHPVPRRRRAPRGALQWPSPRFSLCGVQGATVWLSCLARVSENYGENVPSTPHGVATTPPRRHDTVGVPTTPPRRHDTPSSVSPRHHAVSPRHPLVSHDSYVARHHWCRGDVMSPRRRWRCTMRRGASCFETEYAHA